jgi:beta-galactosidase/beta-glucuronidase
VSWLPRLALALALLFLAIVPASAADRTIVPLAAEWRFIRADVAGAEAPGFDDKKWLTVTLPHTLNGSDGETAGYYRGGSWYRRAFEVKALAVGRRVFVQFDGAATRADVYVNGRFIGRHDGGHAGFRFDITTALKPGRNLLAVRVDNSSNKAITPLGGDFTIFGGLYRPVSLIEADAVHFDLLDHGGPGIYARTDGTASVSVDARVTNSLSKARRASVFVRLLDADGREVARSTRGVRVPARSVRVANLRLDVPNPRLWDGVRDPYLYRLVASIGGGDEVTVPFGFRTFRIDPALGFILNGKPYPLHGANLMHSARPVKGTAVTDAEIAEDFAILREMGPTGVRLVHFQHPRAAYDEADRLGLVAWTEIGINSEVADTPEFRANAAQQLRELIAQNYNHPSVVMWGLGNEVYSTEPYVARILAELNAVARSADPHRPTTYAHCCQGDDDPKALVTDVIGFNRYFGWYPDAKGTIGEWADRARASLPNRPIAVSEYGAGASILHQEDPPAQPVTTSGWHPEQYQALYHERNWRELKEKPYLWGKFIWVAFDLASAGRKEGDRPGINDKGIVTYDRQVRKDAFYWYQANWSDVPMLHLTSKRFTTRFDRRAEVKAYTNAGAATLVLNGREVGRVEPADHILRWTVELQDGENRIEVRGADGKLTDSAVWTYQKSPILIAPR